MESFELPEVTDECEDVSHRCLVRKILAPKILNKLAVTKILLTAWKTRAGVSITPWKENIYLFQFEDLEDRSRVLLEAPWSVMESFGPSDTVAGDWIFDGALFGFRFMVYLSKK